MSRIFFFFRPYLLQEEVLVGLHAHGVLVFAAHLVEEPVQRVVVTLGVLHQAVPQDVHLLQTQSWETRETLDIISLLLLPLACLKT